MCDCTPVGGIDLASFNATLTARFNRVLEGIRRGEATPKEKGRRARQAFEYFNAREVQKRGALHTHTLVTPSDGALVISQRLLRELVIRHGFGHKVDVQRIGEVHKGRNRTAAGAASYVAKYVAKSADQRERVPWEGGTSATFRTWTASRGWGQTMKAVKDQAREYARASEPEGLDALVSLTVSYAGIDVFKEESSAVDRLADDLRADKRGASGWWDCYTPPAPSEKVAFEDQLF